MLASARLRSTFGRRDLGDPFWLNTSFLLQPPSLAGGRNRTFVDSSANGFAVTAVGDVYQTADGPVPGGSSAYLDGSGDRLTVADNAALQMGVDDFTLEFWYKSATSAGFPTLWDKGFTGSGGFLWQSNTLYLGTTTYPASQTIPESTWTHVALCRSGNVFKMYYNGVQVVSATNNINLNSTSPLLIGMDSSLSDNSSAGGYISDFRIVKGTALYTAAFTPPTAPLTAVSGTSLLLNMNNLDIADKSPQSNTVTLVGDAQTSTATPLDGMGSVTFDGSGDWLLLPDSPAWDMPSDFTIEFWVRPTSLSGRRHFVSHYSDGSNGFLIRSDSTSLFFGYGDASILSVANVMSVNTWQHIAACRSGSTLRLFKNGVQVGSTTFTTAMTGYAPLHVGVLSVNPTWQSYWGPFSGQLADLRITKGFARYTQSFTPPTKPHPTQ